MTRFCMTRFAWRFCMTRFAWRFCMTRFAWRFCMTRFLVLVITEAEHLVEIGAVFMDRDGEPHLVFVESKQLLHVMSINESPVKSCIYVGAVSRTAA